jgi:3-phosphoshikimate 1-carboxyvinyltransferase
MRTAGREPGFDVLPGGGRPPARAATADVGGSATALRFLAAVCALAPGPFTLTGTPQLRSRPAGAVVTALRSLGVSVKGSCGGGEGVRPPLLISGGPPRGCEVEVDASASSHALSALLLIGPHLPEGLLVRASGAIASRPYVELTLRTLRSFGAGIEESDAGWFVAPTGLRLRGAPRIEGDWSCAAYVLAAAAATDGEVHAVRVDADSAQPDRRVVEILRRFGASVTWRHGGPVAGGRVSRPVDVDLRDAPDLAPLVGALGCLAQGTTRVRGGAHLRIKETDRIAAVVRCARALGCDARELEDGFEVTGPARHGATIDPEGDHRIAMAFAVAGLAVPGTRIADPGCVAKSYPPFWEDLEALLRG